MKVTTTIQFTEWGRREPKTGNRKIKNMWVQEYESNGIVNTDYEMDSDGNLQLTLWCHEKFCGDHDGDHFIFIIQKKNVTMSLSTKVMVD